MQACSKSRPVLFVYKTLWNIKNINEFQGERHMGTYVATKDSIERKWLVIDAEGMVLGRLATEVARLLRGKHKPTYTPFLDTGDYVIVVNASKMVLTGKKLDQKVYRYHTRFPTGLKEVKYSVMMDKNPEKALELAVKGMLPKNSLGRQMFRKLHVYAGPEHEQTAQQPEAYTF
jgi:large subunit ribosomal protein L13